MPQREPSLVIQAIILDQWCAAWYLLAAFTRDKSQQFWMVQSESQQTPTKFRRYFTMTRFHDLDAEQKDAFKELLLRAIDRRIREEMDCTSQVNRLLLLGNGAGVAILVTFMGAVASNGNPLAEFAAPLWKFFIGCVLAALISFPTLAVASQATFHIERQATAFFQNQMDIEALEGYGFNRFGRWFVTLLSLMSLSFFSWGVYQCIQILKSL